MLPPSVLSILNDDLEKVDLHLKNLLDSDNPVLSKIGHHIWACGGKRVRPILLLLSAQLAGFPGPKDRAIHLSGIIEFIHIATLLHDDVIDEAHIRRGKPSANQIWGNQFPVLVGDYLYARSFFLLVEDQEPAIMKTVSSATATVTDGEILQLQKSKDFTTTEEEYIEIIAKKTSCLMAASCKIGAILGRVSEEQIEALHKYGTYTGIAFQLVDDLLDYVSQEKTLGKPVLNDLKSGNCTLPLIRTINLAGQSEVERLRQILSKPEYSSGELGWISDLIKKYGGDKYTIEQAKEYIQRAKQELSVFDDSIYKKALFDLADFIVQREF